MVLKKCDGDCFNCKFSDCILDYEEVPTNERIDDFIVDDKIVKRRERARRKYKENREHIRALWDKHYYANKEKFKEYKHNYYLKNKDRIQEQQLIYQKNRRKKIKEKNPKQAKKQSKEKQAIAREKIENAVVNIIGKIEKEF